MNVGGQIVIIIIGKKRDRKASKLPRNGFEDKSP